MTLVHAPRQAVLRTGARWNGLAILIAGVGLTAALSWRSWRDAWTHLDEEFHALARERANLVELALATDLDLADDVRRFFEGSTEVTDDEFQSFVASPHVLPGVLAQEWIAYVPRERLASWGVTAERQAHGEHLITERGDAGRRVPAGERAEYFPLVYVAPRSEDESPAGHDLASEPAVAEALRRARDSGEPTVTAPIVVSSRDSARRGFRILVPVRMPGALGATIEQRRAGLRGMASTVVDATALLEDALDPMQAPGLVVQLVDLDAPAAGGVLAERFPRLAAGNASDRFATPPPRGMRFEKALTFAGRHYRIGVKPNDAFVAYHLNRSHRWTPLVGFVVTSLVTLLVRTLATERHRAETLVRSRTAELRESEGRLSLAVQAAQLGLWDWDLRTNAVYFSPEWKRQLGCAPHELADSYEEWASRLHPEDRDATVALARHWASGAQQDCAAEFRLRHQDGSWRWILSRAVLLRDVAGLPVRLIGVHQDVTERREIEQALRRSEATHEAILGSALIAIVTMDHEGRIVDFNPAAERTFGYSRAEAAGRLVAELVVPPAYRAAHQRGLAHFVEAGEGSVLGRQLEMTALRKGGVEFPVDLTVVHLAATTPPLFAGFLIDGSERKRTEDALRKLSRAVEQSPVSIMITDTEGSIEYVNPEFTRMTGYSEEEVRGRNPRLLQSGETPVETYRELWTTILAGGVWRGELHNRKKSGEVFWEMATISPIHDASGRITHYVGIKEDISVRRQLEEQLRQAQKMEAIGQLAGGVAHDFNNILTAVFAHLDFLGANPSLDFDARVVVAELEKGAQRAANLTRQLLLFGRRSMMQPKVLDLNEVLADLEKMLRRILGEQLVFERIAADGLPRIRADRGMLEQVVVNLCVNARDAMPNGGRLTIRTTAVELDALSASAGPAARAGRFVRLSVADNGVGIDDATRERIFEPFFTTKGVGKGTGLGLATVHAIVERHQGWIEVDSALGRGTTISVYLPASESAAPPLAEALPHPEPRAVGASILLVEDDDGVRAVLAKLLRAWGYRVIEACDALEALHRWESERHAIDLLYTDAVMPGGMSGVDLIHRLRADDPALKVVLSSGYSAELARQNEVAALGVSFVAKPASAADIAAAVNACLSSAPTTSRGDSSSTTT